MKRFLLGLGLVSLVGFAAFHPRAPKIFPTNSDSAILRVVSASGNPVPVRGLIIPSMDAPSGESQSTRVELTLTPVEIKVPEGDFTATFWQTEGKGDLLVEFVEDADTSRFWSTPNDAVVLFDQRAEHGHLVGSAER